MIIEDISIDKVDHHANKISENDEINDIAKSVEKLALNIKKMAEYATEIGKGNFNSSFSPISDFDVLGKSLINMSSSIQETSLKITEESKKTAHALNVKSEFLSTISHELRTPLNAIIGTIDLLLQESTSNEHKESLNIIKFSSNNLNSIITNILDFNTMNSGKFELEEIPLNLRSLIKNTYLSFLKQSKEKNLEFNLNFENTPEDLLIISDPTRLNQILSNLISNAIKFTEKGYIEMNIFVTEQNEDNCKIRFSISDSGIGINAENLNYIFEVFTQEDSSITRKHTGVGIGLVITKGILDSYNSKMEVISKVGIGTKFSFEICFKSINKQIQIPEIINDKTKVLDGKRFLVVDDNKINLIILSKIISKYNSAVETSSNGLSALEKIKSNANFDFILMDLQMPIMDGYEASKLIKEINPNIPIIAVTGEAILDVKSKISDAGIDDYILKPINPEILIDKIHKFISK